MKLLTLVLLSFLSVACAAAPAKHKGPDRTEVCQGVYQFGSQVLAFKDMGITIEEVHVGIQEYFIKLTDQDGVDYLKGFASEIYRSNDPGFIMKRYYKDCMEHKGELDT